MHLFPQGEQNEASSENSLLWQGKILSEQIRRLGVKD